MAKRPRKKRSGPRPPRQPRTARPQGGANPAALQQQMAQLQEEMAKTQDALKDEQVTATVGGGMITAVATGQQELVSITIDPQVVDPEDVEMLEDMVVAAVNEVLEKSRELAAEQMSAYTAGLDIPGLI
jgi:DNA-binding YbaB/EbfC family protein